MNQYVDKILVSVEDLGFLGIEESCGQTEPHKRQPCLEPYHKKGDGIAFKLIPGGKTNRCWAASGLKGYRCFIKHNKEEGQC